MPFGNDPLLFYVIAIWSLIWKGIALWKAAQNDQKIWFVAILILNTLGILEIIYLFKFARKPLTFQEIKSWKNLLPGSQK